MRLAQDASDLSLHGQAAMWNRPLTQKGKRILNTESRGIQDDENLGKQSFYQWFTGLARNQGSDFQFLLMKQALKLAKHRNSLFRPNFVPCRLGCASSEHRSMYLGIGGNREFAQRLSGRGIHRNHLARRDLKIRHVSRKVHAGERVTAIRVANIRHLPSTARWPERWPQRPSGCVPPKRR